MQGWAAESRRDARRNESGTMKKETVGGWFVSETFKVSDCNVRVYLHVHEQCVARSRRVPSVKDKIEAIRSFPVLNKGKETCLFISPVTNLTKSLEPQRLNWTRKCEEAFEKL